MVARASRINEQTPEQRNLAQTRRQPLEDRERVLQVIADRVVIAPIDGQPGSRLELVRPQGHVLAPFAIQTPRLALRHTEQPAPPIAIAIRLALHELRPRERTRVLDHLRRRHAHRAGHRLDQLVVEGPEQPGFVGASRRAGISVGHLDRSGRLTAPADKRISSPRRKGGPLVVSP
jgi:hypothetical protein